MEMQDWHLFLDLKRRIEEGQTCSQGTSRHIEAAPPSWSSLILTLELLKLLRISQALLPSNLQRGSPAQTDFIKAFPISPTQWNYRKFLKFSFRWEVCLWSIAVQSLWIAPVGLTTVMWPIVHLLTFLGGKCLFTWIAFQLCYKCLQNAIGNNPTKLLNSDEIYKNISINSSFLLFLRFMLHCPWIEPS